MYDAIVVGARCAGAPTAMLLARKGYRVLLLDKATFPSDLPMSTHLITLPGVAQLRRWGLHNQVLASNCPPVQTFRFDLGPITLSGAPTPLTASGIHSDDLPARLREGNTDTGMSVSALYSPRRIILDRILVEAAVAAGAELRERCTVDGVLTDPTTGRVVGIQAHGTNGALFSERARIVIGADGMYSRIARLVQAVDYRVSPPVQGTYFSYWSGVPVTGLEFYPRDSRAVYAWSTNDDLTVIGVNWAAHLLPAVRRDVEHHFRQVIADVAPDLAARMRAGKRAGRWSGGPIANFVRKPYGSGWALVGDAGYLKDPCTAQGISDAFRDATLLADAVDAGFTGQQSLDARLADYEQQRNTAALPMYEFTLQLATFAPPLPDMIQLYRALQGNQEQTNRFFGIIAGSVPVQEFFAPDNLQRLLQAIPPLASA